MRESGVGLSGLVVVTVTTVHKQPHSMSRRDAGYAPREWSLCPPPPLALRLPVDQDRAQPGCVMGDCALMAPRNHNGIPLHVCMPHSNVVQTSDHAAAAVGCETSAVACDTRASSLAGLTVSRSAKNHLTAPDPVVPNIGGELFCATTLDCMQMHKKHRSTSIPSAFFLM